MMAKPRYFDLELDEPTILLFYGSLVFIYCVLWSLDFFFLTGCGGGMTPLGGMPDPDPVSEQLAQFCSVWKFHYQKPLLRQRIQSNHWRRCPPTPLYQWWHYSRLSWDFVGSRTGATTFMLRSLHIPFLEEAFCISHLEGFIDKFVVWNK